MRPKNVLHTSMWQFRMWHDMLTRYIYYRDCLVCTIWRRVNVTMLLRNNVTVQLYNFIANHTTPHPPHPPHHTTPITPHHNNPAHTTSHFTTLSTYFLLIALTLQALHAWTLLSLIVLTHVLYKKTIFSVAKCYCNKYLTIHVTGCTMYMFSCMHILLFF